MADEPQVSTPANRRGARVHLERAARLWATQHGLTPEQAEGFTEQYLQAWDNDPHLTIRRAWEAWHAEHTRQIAEQGRLPGYRTGPHDPRFCVADPAIAHTDRIPY